MAQRRAPTSWASTGTSTSTRGAVASARRPSRATSTRRAASAAVDSAVDGGARGPRARGPRRRAHLQPRPRRPALDRPRRCSPRSCASCTTRDGRACVRTGVLVMAYGTPTTPEDVEAYYTRIRHGRPPTPEQLADLRAALRRDRRDLAARPAHRRPGRRRSPRALEAPTPGALRRALRLQVRAAAARRGRRGLRAEGFTQVVGLVLAPHSSSMSTDQYMARARAALGDRVDFVEVGAWWDAPGFLRAHRATRARRARRRARRRGATTTEVIFSAHSLPEKILGQRRHLPRAAARERRRRGRDSPASPRWDIAWQSAGRTADPWIGPDIFEVLRAEARRGVDRRRVVPDRLRRRTTSRCSSTSTSRPRASPHEVGLNLVRTASLNDDPDFIDGAGRRRARRRVSGARLGRRRRRRHRRTGRGLGADRRSRRARRRDAARRGHRGARATSAGRWPRADFAGRTIDLGADGFLARRPEALDARARARARRPNSKPSRASGRVDLAARCALTNSRRTRPRRADVAAATVRAVRGLTLARAPGRARATSTLPRRAQRRRRRDASARSCAPSSATSSPTNSSSRWSAASRPDASTTSRRARSSRPSTTRRAPAGR